MYLTDFIVFAYHVHRLSRQASSRSINTLVISGNLCRDVDLFKLAVTIIAIISRYIRQFEPDQPEPTDHCDEVPYFETETRNKEDKITGYQLGFSLQTDVPFQIDTESSASAFFTWLGVSREFQTGDEHFDRNVYLGCDHPLLLQALKQQESARLAILALLQLPGAKKIWSDGMSLWFSRTCEHTSASTEQQLLLQLARVLAPVAEATRKQPAPFFWRYLTIEAVVWGIFGYAGVAFAEYYLVGPDYHLDSNAVLQTGLAASLLLFAILMLLIVLLLRGSSRSHQIVTESFVLLLLALPLCGVQLVSDLNRNQDQAKAEMVLVPIKDKRIATRRKGPDGYILYLSAPPRLFGTRVPHRIEVSEAIYHKAAIDKQLLLVVKPGWLGLPWYQRMDVYPQHAELRPR